MASIVPSHGPAGAQSSTPAPPQAISEKPKSEKEIEKERKKAEKLKKYEAKQKPVLPTAKKPKKKAAGPAAKYVEDTPPGEKKKLRSLDTDEFMKSYSPQAIESAWGLWWEAQGFFTPSADKPSPKGAFTIVIPPPNITGKLHLGHALATALQDAMIRFNRMRGLKTLYLPGCDHASLSAQAVKEQQLWKDERKTRHDFGRERFLELMWAWKKEYHGKINNSLRRVGKYQQAPSEQRFGSPKYCVQNATQC